ncbi:MAG: hypothetical protein IKE18_03145 [Oscillospiraceae bacterium]|nr:hypothetical protein [Oscillospiraceae bacterium]
MCFGRILTAERQITTQTEPGAVFRSVKTEGLAQLGSQELAEKLASPDLSGIDLLEKSADATKRIQAEKQAEAARKLEAQKQAEDAKELEAQKQNVKPGKPSIKDRAKMFESGPQQKKPDEETKAKPSDSIRQRAAMFGPM